MSNRESVSLSPGRYQKIDLRQFGFTTAAENKADPVVFEGTVQSLYAGKYLDQDLKVGLTEETRKNLTDRIQSLDQEIETCTTDLNDIKSTREKNIALIAALREDVNRIKRGKDSDGATIEQLPGGTFSMTMFLVALLPCIALTFYLVLFYISITYRALLLSTTAIAEQLADGVAMNNVLPSTQEIGIAIQTNWIVLVAPAIFVAFGVALHFTLFNAVASQRQKIMGWAFLVVTFVLDVLIAIGIHGKLNEANSLIGQSSTLWRESTDFYLVILLGFVVFLIWSFLFHLALGEWQKRNIAAREIRLMRELTKENAKSDGRGKALLARKQTAEREKTTLQNELDVVYMWVHDLRHNVSTFYRGWMMFIDGAAPLYESQRLAAEKIFKLYNEPRFKDGRFTQ